MKKIIILSIITALTACSSGDADNKVQQLEKLRAQYNEIGNKISELEEELTRQGLITKDKKTVQIENFALAPFQRIVTVQGVVDGDDIVSVNPTMSGKVTSVAVKVGQRVNKGDVMAQIDDEVLRKSMKELKTALDLANTMYKKQAALWKDSIGSEIQYIQAKNTKESLEAKIASLNEQMELYTLRAPIDANVDVVNLRVGQLASPQMTGIVLVNFENLKVKAQISEAYSAVVDENQTIDVEFPDINKTFPLKVSAVSNYIDPKNRSFTIEAQLPKINEIKANMLAKIGLVTYKNEAAFAVPINLIQKNGAQEFIWIADQNNKAAKKIVTTGNQAENLIEIVDGINNNDNVITVGYQGLTEGEEVIVKK